MEVKEGHYYKTRDGEVFGPACRVASDCKLYPWKVGAYEYTNGGRLYATLYKTGYDLVENLGPVWPSPSGTRPEKLTVKEGHYYKTRGGEVVGPAQYMTLPIGRYIWRVAWVLYPAAHGPAHEECYTLDGHYMGCGYEHPFDLVEDLGEFEPVLVVEDKESKDYMAQLAAKCNHRHKFLQLLETDEAFYLAAEKLANKLAHALLHNGEVCRRKTQSRTLFVAAIHLLIKEGITVTLIRNDNFAVLW